MSFAVPAVLFALIALPAIWFLLRLTPPRPRTETFPPTRLLLEIARKDETPAQTPWWLILLRLILGALIILALAGPILRPSAEEAPGDGPLLIVFDNGWVSAERFDAMRDTANAILDLAEDAGRPVAFAATAEAPAQVLAPTDAGAVRERLATLQPEPLEADRAAIIAQLAELAAGDAFGGAVWFSDGIGGPDGDAMAVFLADALSGPVIVYSDLVSAVVGILPPESTADALNVPVIRRDGGVAGGRVIARDLEGRVIADVAFTFGLGADEAIVRIALPTELRNDIVRLEIAGQETAGAVQLLDERYRRRTVGIIAGAPSDQPLLSADYYLTRALQPFADLRVPSSAELPQAIGELIDGGVSAIALADIGTLPEVTETALAAWVEAGGTLIRFAGPRLAAAEPTLIPVRLRLGGRTLGGALSWETPQLLGDFPRESPFFGLPVPPDVLVERQVLAEPDADLPGRTYASLADGTPLVTGARRGEGLLVLFHVTADPSWSNLPLSGVFVEMLRRVVALSSAPAATDAEGGATVAALNPYRVLDGYGRFTEPGAADEPIPGGNAPIVVDRSHPPGLYGSQDSFRALSLLVSGATLPPLDLSALGGDALRAYPDAAPIELRPWLLALALAVFLLDALAVLWLNGAFSLRRGTAAAAVIIGVAFAGLPGFGSGDALAQQALTPADQLAMAAANRTSLAYVVTGNVANDDLSLAGLRGLSAVLTQRTSFEPGEPIGLDLAIDELAFYPLIYWRIDPAAPMPSAAAIARLEAYMRSGGSVLFDTADQLEQITLGPNGATPATQRLRDMMATLDLPALEPVPAEHVLTKSFYLLTDFPGRLVGGPLWVEAGGVDANGGAADGVSPVLVTSNDLAGAWAIDDRGAFLLPAGTAESRQREFAFRVGVNIVMYALTGNYKTDQVHIPAILERLGE